MASACVNNIDCAPAAFPAYGWLSPRISFSREYSNKDSTLFAASAKPHPNPPAPETSDPSKDAAADFEFLLDDPVAMLPADELFSDGKLVPLQLSATRSATSTSAAPAVTPEEVVRSPEGRKSERLSVDPYLFSPKAPRCSSHWRELLGLKKLYQNNKANSSPNATTSSSTPTTTTSSNAGKSIRQFLLRNSKSLPESATDASLNLPLLKDSECESISVSSSRLSLSSSSSGHDFDDLPRLSLDSDIKPGQPHAPLSRSSSGSNHGLVHPRVRMVKPRMVPASIAENPKPLIDHPSAPTTTVTRTVSVDSPRMSSSGKIVFQSLERSSSSPSSFNGGPRYKHRGMERSYSSNVRITPVLNVPVYSLRGSSKSGVFGLFSSQSQKKEGSNGSSEPLPHHHQHRTCRVRRETS